MWFFTRNLGKQASISVFVPSLSIFTTCYSLGSVQVEFMIHCCLLYPCNHALGRYFSIKEWNTSSCPVWWNSVIFSRSFMKRSLNITSCTTLWLGKPGFSQFVLDVHIVYILKHPLQEFLFAIWCTIDIHFSFSVQVSPLHEVITTFLITHCAKYHVSNWCLILGCSFFMLWETIACLSVDKHLNQ